MFYEKHKLLAIMALTGVISATSTAALLMKNPVSVHMSACVPVAFFYSLDDADADGVDFDVDSTFSINPYIGIHFPVNSAFAINTKLEYFHNSEADFSASYSGRTLNNIGTFTANGVLFSAYAEFNPEGIFAPFVGAGIGSSWNECNLSGYSDFDSDSSFSAHVTAGLEINVCRNFAFDAVVHVISYASDTSGVNAFGGLKFSF